MDPTLTYEAVARLLGGRPVLGAIPHSAEAYISLIRDGFPSSVLDFLATMGLTLDEFSKSVGLDKRTLQRRKAGGDRLTSVESERLFRMARVLACANEVFADPDKARTWLRRESRALGGQRPIDLLDTDLGTEEVLAELGRIEHGVFG